MTKMKIKIDWLAIIGVLMMSLIMSNPLYAEIDVTTGLPPGESTQKEIEPLLGVDGEGNILWDTYHGIYLDYSPSGVFSSLKTLLEGKGYTVDENSSGVLNLELSNYNIIVICIGSAWNSPYSAAEVAAIENFVNAGGRLLIMGDNQNTPNANINPISQKFGTTVGLSTIDPNDLYVTNLTGHPIFSGVSEIFMRAAGEINGVPPSSEEALSDNGEAVVTVAESGLWRVITLGDNNIMDNNYIISSDNQLFSENVFDWLTAPTWGRAYKVLFSRSADLELLRQYRDEVLSKTAKGRKYKKLLYKNSERALAVLLENPELMAQAKDLIYANILAVDDVLHGQEGIIYNTDEIAAFLNAYARKAPGRLKFLAKIVKRQMLKKQRKGKLFFGFRLE